MPVSFRECSHILVLCKDAKRNLFDPFHHKSLAVEEKEPILGGATPGTSTC